MRPPLVHIMVVGAAALCVICFHSVLAAESVVWPVYKGCYYADRANAFLNAQLLSWDDCVNLCDYKNTLYRGVQPEESSFFNCYCGNDLATELIAANSSLCGFCVEGNATVHCGSNQDTIAVFQITDHVKLKLILAAETGVTCLTEGNNATVVLSVGDVLNVAFDFFKNRIFYTTKMSMWRTAYSPHSMAYVTPTKVVSKDIYNGFYLSGLAIDWIENKNYFTTYYPGYDGKIYRMENDKIDHLQLYINGHGNINCVQFDPFKRLLFYIQEKNLIRYDTVKGVEKIYKSGKDIMPEIQKISLDINRNIIYMIRNDGVNTYITSVDYEENNNLRKLAHGPQLTNVKAFDVFDNEAVWANENDGGCVIYRCRLTPRCLPQDIQEFYVSSHRVNHLIIYRGEAQMNLCAIRGCSYGCSVVSVADVRCSCPPSMRMAADNRTCLDDATTPQAEMAVSHPADPAIGIAAEYVGCFDVSDWQSNAANKVHQPLLWEECAIMCNNRMSKFMGVQVEESVHNFCFCGASLPQKPLAADSLCRPCLENSTLHCGSPPAAAFYTLRDEPQLAVLLATDTGVQLLTIGPSSTPSTLVPTAYPVTDVDYYYAGDTLYFVSDSELWSSHYSYISKEYVQPKSTDVSCRKVEDYFIVDWLYERLYCECSVNHHYEPYRYHFTSGGLMGHNSSYLAESSGATSDVDLDVYRGLLFYVQGGKLNAFKIDEGTKNNVYNMDKFNLRNVYKISLNTTKQQIYMVVSEDGIKLHIVSIDYKNTKKRVLYKGPLLTNCTGFSVWGDNLVWANTKDNRSIVYRCKLSHSICSSNDITAIYQEHTMVNNLRIYHRPESAPDLCADTNCSHQCEVGSLSLSAQCSCPTHMVLGPDNTTCIDLPTTKSQRVEPTTEGIRLAHEATSYTLPKSHLRIAVPNHVDSYEDTDYEIKSPSVINNVDTSATTQKKNDADTTRTLNNVNLEMKELHRKPSRVNVIELVVSVGVFATICLLIVLILQIRYQRNRCIFMNSYSPAEIEELALTHTFNT